MLTDTIISECLFLNKKSRKSFFFYTNVKLININNDKQEAHMPECSA